MQDIITTKLLAAFAPESLHVEDESHLHEGHAGHRPGGETHFRLYIVVGSLPREEPARTPPHDQCGTGERAQEPRPRARHPCAGAGRELITKSRSVSASAICGCRTVSASRSSARQIEPMGEHRELAVGVARPLFLGPVPIKLDAVVVGIAQIKRLADAVVGGAFERNVRPRSGGAAHRPSCAPRRIEDGEMVEAGGAERRRRAAVALPGIEPDMMMIAAGGNERSAAARRCISSKPSTPQ